MNKASTQEEKTVFHGNKSQGQRMGNYWEHCNSRTGVNIKKIAPHRTLHVEKVKETVPTGNVATDMKAAQGSSGVKEETVSPFPPYHRGRLQV